MRKILILIEIFIIIVFVFIYFRSKNKYFIHKDLSKKEYPLKKILNVGFYILDCFNFNYKSDYCNKIYKKYIILKGEKKAFNFKKIHLGQKVIYIFLATLISINYLIIAKISIFNISFSIFLIVYSFYGKDKELNKKVENKILKIKIEIPEFLNQLSLLIGAGLNIQQAIKTIVNENQKDNPLYTGLEVMQKEIKNGIHFNKALKNLAFRYKIKELSRVVSILLQNYKKGSNDLVKILDENSQKTFNERKRNAKLVAEKINNKLLFPMMIMLVAILLILGTPAIILISSLT
ncbi:MAG: type II secretion system F family protein [Bacillota bacterium]